MPLGQCALAQQGKVAFGVKRGGLTAAMCFRAARPTKQSRRFSAANTARDPGVVTPGIMDSACRCPPLGVQWTVHGQAPLLNSKSFFAHPVSRSAQLLCTSGVYLSMQGRRCDLGNLF